MRGNNDKPKTPTAVPEKSKSQSGLSQANSVRSQTINKLPCESHYFEMRPNSDNPELHYRQRLAFFFTHEAKEVRPYPVVLEEFIDVEYLPFFGSENQIESFRKNKNKYRTSFYEEKSKASEDLAKKDIVTAVPKHKYCQICKLEFENYEKHIVEGAHLRTLRNSYGNDVIDDFVEDYLEKRQDSHEEELAFLNKLTASINDANSCF